MREARLPNARWYHNVTDLIAVSDEDGLVRAGNEFTIEE
jgi:hypothetical protein